MPYLDNDQGIPHTPPDPTPEERRLDLRDEIGELRSSLATLLETADIELTHDKPMPEIVRTLEAALTAAKAIVEAEEEMARC